MRRLGAVNPWGAPDLTSISVWIKADGLVLPNNSSVSSFTDFSGLGRHYTASGVNRPTYVTAQRNGLPGVSFDGVDDEMTVNLDSGTTAYSFFMVLKLNATGGTPVPFRYGDTNNAALFLLSGGNRFIQHRNAGATTSLGDGAATTNWELWSVTCASSGSNPDFRVNGSSQVLSPTNGAYGTFAVGSVLGSFSGSLRTNMILGEMLIYKAAVTSAARSVTEGYLRRKWGL